ncbi:MAG: hypothetical protein ACR2PL_19840 [Dehalococcoidia bacterium]
MSWQKATSGRIRSEYGPKWQISRTMVPRKAPERLLAVWEFNAYPAFIGEEAE